MLDHATDKWRAHSSHRIATRRPASTDLSRQVLRCRAVDIL
ncbi:hypothetical protein I553_3763 [Mycobacterium xenopi 4042]|uniref:Uncharacterized protein n=1 Tax=Mycobacterium xenopi 4042 TaxID=1299334 RepID=X8C2Y2_MYCXE|nr:hypothetical protein I553_10151 [Mycobacterium xenopi 4042]EUA49798.1 hypothetical protein I553_3763 [Mycobacterium xenopi 4042]